MQTFSKSFFGGYQRDEVDDYIDSLLRELDQLKSGVQKELEAEKRRSAELETALQTSEDQCARLLEQVARYETKYGDLQELLVESRVEAKKVAAQAQLNAQEIRSRAQAEADSLLNAAHKEAAEQIEQAQTEIDQMQRAAELREEQIRLGIQRQTEAIETLRSSLMRIYQELGGMIEPPPEEDAGKKLTTISAFMGEHPDIYGT